MSETVKTSTMCLQPDGAGRHCERPCGHEGRHSQPGPVGITWWDNKGNYSLVATSAPDLVVHAGSEKAETPTLAPGESLEFALEGGQATFTGPRAKYDPDRRLDTDGLKRAFALATSASLDADDASELAVLTILLLDEVTDRRVAEVPTRIPLASLYVGEEVVRVHDAQGLERCRGGVVLEHSRIYGKEDEAIRVVIAGGTSYINVANAEGWTCERYVRPPPMPVGARCKHTHAEHGQCVYDPHGPGIEHHGASGESWSDAT